MILWQFLMPMVLLLFVAWMWQGPVLIGKVLDPVSRDDPARAFLAVAVLTALPVWVGAVATIVSMIGKVKRQMSLVFAVVWGVAFLPTVLLIPGGRTGVSERWLLRGHDRARDDGHRNRRLGAGVHFTTW